MYYYIQLLNKEKKVKKDTVYFSTEEKAVSWGKEHLSNFNMDMVHVVLTPTLLKDVFNEEWARSEISALTDFLKENPEWENSIVLSDNITYNFRRYIYFDLGWLVMKKKRLYNLIIGEIRNWGHCKVYTKRVYQYGEKAIKRPRRPYSDGFDSTHPSREIKVDIPTLKNACQIWSFSVLLGIPYSEAYQRLYEEGWRENDTICAEERWKRALRKINKEFILFWDKRKAQKGCSLKNIFQIVPKKGTFAVFIRGHVLSIKDGVMYDNVASSPYSHIIDIWEIK